MTPAPKRRILRAEVKRLALCRRGANGVAALFKEDGVEFRPLVKFDEVKGELLALAYRADGKPDSEGDFADAAAVRGMVHSFMRNGAELELGHIVLGGTALTKTQAHVAENFVIQQGDPRFAGWKDESGQPVDATNGWGLLIKIDDPELKKKYGPEGEWNGVSLFAPSSEVEYLAKEEYDGRGLRRAVKENQMDETKLTTMLDERFASLTKAITDALKPAPKKEEEPAKPVKDDAPVLAKEDRGDPKKVREFLEAKKRHDLQKSVNWNDPKEVENYLTGTLEKKADEKDETPDLKKAREELAAKEREIEDLVKMSGQRPADAAAPKGPVVGCGLSKEGLTLAQEGIRRAEWINKRNGRA